MPSPDLILQKADLAIADLSITYEREKAVDFSNPFMTLGISILYRKPRKQEPALFAFMSPLDFEVWIYMVFAYFIVSLLLFILARWQKFKELTFNISIFHGPLPQVQPVRVGQPAPLQRAGGARQRVLALQLDVVHGGQPHAAGQRPHAQVHLHADDRGHVVVLHPDHDLLLHRQPGRIPHRREDGVPHRVGRGPRQVRPQHRTEQHHFTFTLDVVTFLLFTLNSVHTMLVEGKGIFLFWPLSTEPLTPRTGTF